MAADTVLAFVMLATLVAYAVLAGADFGAGVWDFLSRGPRRAEQRRAIADAIGPVWEANHVWLIFLIVLLFTCFPPVYAAASTALFWPLHLVLIGIVLRGTAFVFRAYGAPAGPQAEAWGHVFGGASAITPMLLGMSLGAVSTGEIRVVHGTVTPGSLSAWLAPLPVMTGLLTVLLCAYLAAVYLAWETQGDVQRDFQHRALVTWLVAGVVSIATLFVARHEAPHLWQGLTTFPAVGLLAAGVLLAPASAYALVRRHFARARVFGAGQVTVLLTGWGAAQWPYLIYPDLTVTDSSAPASTLSLTFGMLPIGVLLLLPSLWFLFAVFKGRRPQASP